MAQEPIADYSYGKWCTVRGERYMITDWDNEAQTVTVFYRGNGYEFDRSEVSEVSDFKETDAERKAKGYAY